MIEVAALAASLPNAAAPALVPANAPPRSAAPDAATRFAELMAQDPPPVSPLSAPNLALNPLAEAVAGSYALRPATLGDQVLQGLQKVQGDFQGHLQSVGRMLDPSAAAPGVTELLRLQLGMAQLAVQVEVVGKAIGRSTQNIDQLVRMQ
jgi:type III secretion protein I